MQNEEEFDYEDPTLADPDGEPIEKPVSILDKAGESQLVAHIIKDISVAEISEQSLNPKNLHCKSHQMLVEIANQYFAKYAKLIPANVLEIAFSRRIENLKSRNSDYEDFQNVLAVPPEAPEYFADQVIEIAKRRQIAEAMKDFATGQERGQIDFDGLWSKIDKAREIGQGKQREYQLLSVSDLEQLPAIEFLIEDHFPVGGTVCIYGPSGSCKSFFCLDMACSIATGTQFLGKHETTRGTVLYINSEGSYNLRSRIAAWCEGHNQPIDQLTDICFLTSTTDISSPSEVDKLIRKGLAKLGKIDVVFVDTLSRNFGEGDTDKNVDMQRYLRGCDRIRESTGAAVVSIHHTGHNEDSRERGAKSLRDYCDSSICVRSPDGGTVEIDCKKQKDIELFAKYRLQRNKAHSSLWLSLADPESAKLKSDPEADLILKLIPEFNSWDSEESQGITVAQLVETSELNKNTVYHRLTKLTSDRLIRSIESAQKNKAKRYVRFANFCSSDSSDSAD